MHLSTRAFGAYSLSIFCMPGKARGRETTNKGRCTDGNSVIQGNGERGTVKKTGAREGITGKIFEQRSEVHSVGMEGKRCRGSGRCVCAKALRWVRAEPRDQGDRSRVKVEERRLKVQREVKRG